MNLFFRKTGQGRPLIILHGLFGSGDNWLSIAGKLPGWEVFLPDLRNHGASPWESHFSIPLMAQDLLEFLRQHQIQDPVLMGHSMGAKTAMEALLQNPQAARGLIAVDMAPRGYEPKYPSFVPAMLKLRDQPPADRTQALAALQEAAGDLPTAQFLLKNLIQTPEGTWKWRLNLDALEANYQEIWKPLETGRQFSGPSLFLRGLNSDYLRDEDLPLVHQLFPRAQVQGIPGAGHWLHAEKPQEFLTILLQFLQTLA